MTSIYNSLLLALTLRFRIIFIVMVMPFSSTWICTAMAAKTWFSLCVLFLCLSSPKTHFCFGADTISIGNSLSGNQTLISAGGEFELGYFKPGNSSYYYIGIWYREISQLTVVWVANRDKPLRDRISSELKILDGNLVLINGSQVPVWSTNLNSSSSNSSEAVLLRDGNLVLRDGPTSSEILWQSFDHPTDTWLPGAKLGLDKRNNRTQSLTSWKNTEDPATGIFSLEHDPAGVPQYLIQWNRSVYFWNSGPWNGQFFSSVPEMRSNYVYNSIQFTFGYESNENESYFTYAYHNSSIKSRFIMDFSGQIKQFSWLDSTQQWYLFWSQPPRQCNVHALCGPFGICNEKTENFCGCFPGFTPSSPRDWNLSDWSGGCKRKTNLQCHNASNGDTDKFVPRPNMRLPVNPQSLATGSPGECEVACLNNCSCTAYAYDSGGCSMWLGNLLHLAEGGGKTLYVRFAASEFLPHKNNKGKVTSIVVGSVAALVALFALVLIILLRQRRSVGTRKLVEGSLVCVSFKDLQKATKNFSEKLGGGGFGSVYKGTMHDSTVVGVKKLESISQGEKQFRSEVSTIGTIQHVNLVRLRGFCSEGDKRLLVYEYMSNHSLNTHLFNKKDSKVLEWKTRYQIALGTARGLAYLHEECRDCIIHCDIKPENILLDAEFCPKVADFGLAKLLGREFSRVLTTIRGTRGYLAPEWILGVPVTAKADVFSYGMMLFEFVSGRRNSEQSEDEKFTFFPTWAASQISEGVDVLNLLDHRLEGRADANELTRVCRIACWCIQDDETRRPSMGQIVQILEGVSDVSLAPVPRSLQCLVETQEHVVFFSESSSGQTRSSASAETSRAKSTSSSTSA